MKQIVFSGKLKDSTLLLDESLDNLSIYFNSKKTLIITDKTVAALYSDRFPPGEVFIIENGEQEKNLETVSAIYTFLIKNECDRTSFILGIGGGSISDIAGFVASTYMRGIGFGFVPTTLLAQVDASIGGKNGVNFDNYKNMIGTFNQPDFILSDHSLLKTLNKNEVKNGFAETIKHGLIKDSNLIKYIMDNKKNLINLQQPYLSKMIEKSVKVKLDIINIDETERGERVKLNFGHTIGHAIEIENKLSHGQAISIGMVFSTILSKNMGLISEEESKIIKNLIKSFGLPIHFEGDYKTLRKIIKKDKKRAEDKINFILLNKIGEAVIKKIEYKHLEILSDMR